ncbi:MAG: hypothetical protein M1324_00195 [Patescibacteria group bacterium]|nr:hypothetical protein [Patescibacteria group bacterium]
MDAGLKFGLALLGLFFLCSEYPYRVLAWVMYDLRKMENSFSGDVAVTYLGDVNRRCS